VSLVLAAGEKVIWQGAPSGLRAFLRPMDMFLFFFALFAAFFFVTTIFASGRGGGTGGSIALVGFFPLIFFGGFFFGPRLWSMWREASGTRYTLTDRRVVLQSRGRRVELDLRTLPYLEFERSWLSGPTIYFAQRNLYEGWGGFYGGSPAPAFRGLADADAVFQQISAARAGAAR
jgi:hypothetical protein